MRAKCTHLLLLTAWLLATGSQWDVVQVFAWSRMFAHNARVLPVRDALELTFSPSDKCSVCRLVEAAREDRPGDNAASAKFLKEPIVFLAGTTIIVAAPTSSPWIETATRPLAHARTAPPTPPPRAVA